MLETRRLTDYFSCLLQKMTLLRVAAAPNYTPTSKRTLEEARSHPRSTQAWSVVLFNQLNDFELYCSNDKRNKKWCFTATRAEKYDFVPLLRNQLYYIISYRCFDNVCAAKWSFLGAADRQKAVSGGVSGGRRSVAVSFIIWWVLINRLLASAALINLPLLICIYTYRRRCMLVAVHLTDRMMMHREAAALQPPAAI